MSYAVHLLQLTCMTVLAASGLRLLVNDANLLFLGQSVFVGAGAYACAIIGGSLGLGLASSLLAALVAGVITGGVVVLLLGGLRDDSIALGSISLMLFFSEVVRNVEGLTRGALGISGIEVPRLIVSSSGRNWTLIAITLPAALFGLVGIEWLRRGRVGALLRAQQDDDFFPASFGYNASRLRGGAITVAALLGALSGFSFAYYIGFVDPTSFSVNDSVVLLTVVALAGRGGGLALLGGVSVAVLLPELFRFLGANVATAGQLRLLVFGSLLAFWARLRLSGARWSTSGGAAE